jgi:hypothetical protein
MKFTDQTFVVGNKADFLALARKAITEEFERDQVEVKRIHTYPIVPDYTLNLS